MSFNARSAFGCAIVVVVAGAATFSSTLALAQTAPQADPGRVKEQVNPPAPMPREVPQIEVRGQTEEHAPAGAAKIKFTLHSLKLDGVSVYSETQLRPVFADKIGQKISLADLYTIANDITRRYRNDGYVLTQVIVPPQTIEGGTARLRVVEGYVDQITVNGGQDSARPQIRSYATSAINHNGPVNIRELERSLLLINDLPGVKARGVLSPSKNATGGADLTILVERKPYDAQLDANNFGTKFLGPYQLGASGALNSALGMNERISGQTVYAPGAHMTPELMYYALGYMQPVGNLGTTVQLDTNYTHTRPGFDLKEFDVKGTSEFVGVTVAHPIIRSRRVNLSAHVGLDGRDVETKDNIEPNRNDRIRALRLGGRFEYLSTMFGAAYNMADVQMSQGLDILGATDNDSLNVSRPGADVTFTKFEAELQRLQRVTSNVNLLLATHGQYSDQPLLTSEEFGVGGLSYGRGYDPSEIIGDSGVAGKAEVQWQKPMPIRFVDDWQAYGFYDAGIVWQHDATSSIMKVNSLASTGIGVRGTFQSGTSLESFLAFPLTRDVQTQGDKDARFFVGLSQRF